MNPWPHQLRSKDAVLSAINEGVRRICLTQPTGSGKTGTAALLIDDYLARQKRVVFYTSRRILLDQSAKTFLGHEFDYGIRAAGHEFEPWKPLQVASLQTEWIRTQKPEQHRGWKIHDADLAIVDEIHANTGETVRNILRQHVEAGCNVLGLTATPVDLGQMVDKLIIGCSMEEARACGALVYGYVYGPDEPDLKRMGIKAKPGEDFSETQKHKAMVTPTIFGRVWDWWRKLNPEMKPTIGFACGVKESLGFAQDFYKRGVRCAHIDGSQIWIEGEFLDSTTQNREQIYEDHRTGRIKAIWNMMVMREGADLRWIEHVILATIFGCVEANLQAIGRGLRASPETGKERCIIQDHGGNWHRFGSPNVERFWELEYTSSIINGLREEYLRKNPDKQPFRCPQCAKIMQSKVCECGFVAKHNRYPRYTVQIDGTLKELNDLPFKQHRITTSPSDFKVWEGIYWGYLKSKTIDKTFREAIGFFVSKVYRWPDPTWKFMPKHTLDLFRRVKAVPRERLY